MCRQCFGGPGLSGDRESRGTSGSRESFPVLMSASLFIRLERTAPFGRLVESRLKILAGVRGNSDMVRAQQGEKERDPEFMVLSWAF